MCGSYQIHSLFHDRLRSSPRLSCIAVARPSRKHRELHSKSLPPYNLGDLVLQQIEDYTKRIALALRTVGLINIQFAVKDDTVYIIEANPRASRTVPFIAKSYGEPYVNHAAKVMLGAAKLKDLPHNPHMDGCPELTPMGTTVAA